MNPSKSGSTMNQGNLNKIDAGYAMIIGPVGLAYWYLGLNMEIEDAATILGMCWFNRKCETRHPTLWIELKFKKALIASISICCGLIALSISKLVNLVIFP